MYRFLLRPKWLLFLAGCVALAVVFVGLGNWQLSRLDQRKAQNSVVLEAREGTPQQVASVLSTTSEPQRSDEYRRVVATGRYDTAHEYLVRGKTVDEEAGLFVLTPLITADGTDLLVARGWIAPNPAGANVAPTVPPAPTGEVTVIGRVRRSESGALQEATISGIQTVKRINTSRIAEQLDGPTYQGFLELTEQTPAADEALTSIPEPEISEGPHLAYAVQWFLFAGLLFVGYGIFARREAEQRGREGQEPKATNTPALGRLT